MPEREQKIGWFWATLVLSSISIVAVVFAFWELVENHYFRDLNYVSLHYLYISRGIASSLLLAAWAAWFVLRQRRGAEAELRRSHARYRGLLESSPGAVVLFDRNLRVAEWNAAAERLYGLRRGEVVGQRFSTVPPERLAELEQLMARVDAGETVLGIETRRCDRFGASIDVDLSLQPYSEGIHRFYLEVTSDISERVRMREMLLEVEKLTSMGKMAAGTAHHLNTPMASLLLRVQMMRDRAPDNDFARDLEQLEKTIGFCQQFIRRLLDFSRRPALQKEEQSIRPLIEAVVGFMSPSFAAKQARLTTELDTCDRRVLADSNQIETLLIILLSNALDALPDRGSVKIRSVSENGRVRIELADDGCGISDTDRERVFEPFFTTKPPGKGTGLGLAIARNIVHEHGGFLGLQSKRGEGTTAVIELPVAAANHVEVAP
ncbi:MAG: two-component system sensor histidine kinase NtrB [Terriglobales bacterium]